MGKLLGDRLIFNDRRQQPSSHLFFYFIFIFAYP